MVRFYIFSHHELCELDKQNFDSALNSEQLEKCLITLRELYQNYRSHYHKPAPFEAEFAGYYLLFRLPSRDFGFYLTQVKEDILLSPEIQLAIKIKQANPISFFRILKTAPYLVSCLMHQSFTQKRASALSQMDYSYSKDSFMSLEEYASLFCFSSIDEAAEFCWSYGIEVDGKLSTKFCCLDL